MAKIKSNILAACAACAVLLSGCGSSLNPFRIDVPNINVPQITLPPSGGGTTSAATISEANVHAMAANAPAFFHNTLSQSASGSAVTLTVPGGSSRPRYMLSKSGGGNNWAINDPASGNVRSDSQSGNVRIGGRSASYQVYAVSRNEGPNRVGIVVFNDRSSPSDTDYLAGGFWSEVRLSGSRVLSYVGLGSFVAGQPHSGGFPASGSATYSGEGSGLYIRDSGIAGVFAGDAIFTAAFNGNATSVSGRLSNLVGEDNNSTINRLSGVQINFNSASNSGGLFSGNISCTGCVGAGASGRWGGAFYGGTPSDAGGAPDLFGGTFAARDVNPVGSANDVDLFGFFLTGKE